MAAFPGDFDPGSDLLSGLPPGVVDDYVKRVDGDIKEKNNRIEHVETQIKEYKERMGVMVEHLKNVQQELNNTQQLIDAKNKELDTEEHLQQLAQREVGRIIQEIGKSERKVFDLQDRLNLTQNYIFRGNEKMDQFKIQMNWNQEEIEQWALAAKQKEEDNLALEKYKRADDLKIKEMNLNLEKLTKQVSTKEQELENEVTETQTAQIMLDKTAADFKILHSERQELVNQWEQAIEAMKRRDEMIQQVGEALLAKKADLAEQERILEEKKLFLSEQEQENEAVQKQTVEAEKVVQRYRAMLQQETQNKQNLQDELEIVRTTLAKVASELSLKRVHVANGKAELEQKRDRLEVVRRKQAETKKRLENEYLATNDLEKSAHQIEMINREQEKTLKSTEKELVALKQEMFKQSQELFNLRKDEANLIAEISGAQSADRNLRDKIKSLDAESQKQQEHIYNADFALQQMERKVSRAQGEYRADEKEALQSKISQLEQMLTATDQEERMLKKQLKKVNDDYRQAKRQVDDLNNEKSSLDDKAHELQLENEVVARTWRTCIKQKEEYIVQHDLLKLEVKKLRDRLNDRADEVSGLQNRKFQLQKTMEERTLEVKAQQEVLRSDLKMAQEELHTVVMELRDREMKAGTLQKKLDLLNDKMRAELGGEEERKSPAYYVVLRAQEREELQKEGDELDARIQKAEKEIRALENTLAKFNAKNDKLRSSFRQSDGSGADSEAKLELEAKLERLLERKRQKKAEADTLAADVSEMRQRLSNLLAEEEGMRRHVKLVQGKAKQFDKEREELLAKRDRARASLDRHSKRLRQARGASGETEEERSFRLASMREENKNMLYVIMSLKDEFPDLAGIIDDAVQSNGIAPPSRPPSARSEVSSIGSTTS
uniref:Coiled-coil domain-containing protein 39 n=1 Tax=Guillardia theta TaxID=55529 RepID=A0A7S4M111_GUITH|mmetsp:Transcript_12571/g.43785  ORF Transcript_12571/g.43785 Transcript_12571/m.43785 type:complete len:892 (+) Transcript_12571:94-2769(+)